MHGARYQLAAADVLTVESHVGAASSCLRLLGFFPRLWTQGRHVWACMKKQLILLRDNSLDVFIPCNMALTATQPESRYRANGRDSFCGLPCSKDGTFAPSFFEGNSAPLISHIQFVPCTLV